MREVERYRLVEGSGAYWRRAPTAEFLGGVGRGTLPRHAFDGWLVENALSVRVLTRFVAFGVQLGELADSHDAPRQQPDYNGVMRREEVCWRMGWEG